MDRKSNWIEKLNATAQKYHEAFGDLTNEQFNWKPSEKEWSIGQCVDHVVVTDRLYRGIIGPVIKGTAKTPLMAHIPGMTSFFGNAIYKAIHEDNAKKGKTFGVFQPSQSAVDKGVLKRLDEEHKVLISNINKLSDSDLNKSIASPVSKVVVYKVWKAIDIVTTHEMRHYYQAKGVLELQKK